MLEVAPPKKEQLFNHLPIISQTIQVEEEQYTLAIAGEERTNSEAMLDPQI